MPTTYTAEYWRQRASEARAQAEQMSDPRARQQLLEIASAYDQMATRAGTNARPNAKPAEG
jgi:hypothetical protein